MKYTKLKDGQWSKASKSLVHYIKCCDCGLIHTVQYELTKSGLRFRAWRHTPQAPRAARRSKHA